MKKVHIESQQRIFDDFFKIDEAFLSFERFDGQMSDTVRRLNFERGDAVAAIIMNRDSRNVILANQFRFPTYEKGPGWITEVVAGILKPDESPEDAVRREILEEVGYDSGDLTHISTFYVSPGGSSERIYLYYVEVGDADRMNSGGGLASEREDIQVVEMSPEELWSANESGEIVDAKTIVALMWLRDRLQN